MGLSKRLVTSAAVVAFAFFAAEADAQHRGGGARSGGSSGVRGGSPRGIAPRGGFSSGARIAPRFSAPRISGPRFAGARANVTRLAPSRSFGLRPGFASRAVIAGRVGGRPFIGGRGFAHRVIGPRIIVAPYRFARPF